MSRMAVVLLIGLAVPGATGCATIVGHKTERLSVNSDPQSAEVRVDGAVQGRTPAVVDVDKKGTRTVEVTMPGYQPQRCPVRMSAAAGYVVADVLLCVFLFPIGCISFIDAGGAWNELDANSCNVSLQPAYAQYGTPPAGYPPQAPSQQPPYSPQANPPPGYPPPYAPQGYAPQGYPPQGYAPQGYPPGYQYPPQGPAPAAYPPPPSYPPGYAPPPAYGPQPAPHKTPGASPQPANGPSGVSPR